MIRIIITLNPSSLRLTSKCVIFSVLGGALSSARKKSRRRYAISCRGGKKERERERAVDTRVFATRKGRRRKGRGNQPSSSSRPFRRREIHAASIVPSTALARVFSLYFVSNLSPYRRIKSIFFISREKTPTLKKQKKNNRDPKYIKQKENFEKFNTILEKTKGG